MNRYEKAVFYGDFHAPFEDPWCVKIAEEFNQWFKPQWVFILGDIIDFTQISKFDTSPDRLCDLQADLNAGKEILERLRTSAPRAKMVLFEGNHEIRLRKYLWKHPEISSLNALTLPAMLNLPALDIKFVGSLTDYDYHGWSIEHGDIVRKWSAYTAHGMLERRGTSGCSGHTHRMGTHYMTDRGGDYVWIENGCMCSRHPHWMKSPDWQNGFTVGWFKRADLRFTLEQVCIPDGKCVYHGKEFGNLKVK